MKLRKIETNLYEYDWGNDTKKYVIVYNNECVIAMFCSKFWAERFKVAASIADSVKMEIFEVEE
jgi:hypothetical protein